MAINVELVRQILTRATAYPWTVQGLGMLRLHLSREGRIHIHIWNSKLMVPNVSVIHNHAWDLTSIIIAGRMVNKRYAVAENTSAPPTHHMQDLVTGEGGKLVGESQRVMLLSAPAEQYDPGEVYSQAASELHESRPSPFTVTVMERSMGPPGEIAQVCWPVGTQWVSAEPRPATIEEVMTTTLGALANWRD